MLKRLLAVTLAIGLAGMTTWSSGPTGSHGMAGAMPLESAFDSELAGPVGGGGGGADDGASAADLSGIAREAGLGDMEGYY